MRAPESRGDGRLQFEPIYREFHDKIERYLNRLVGAGDAQDATQEVFSKVSQALPGFRGDSSLSTWIYRIATNTAYDRMRARSSPRGSDLPLDGAPPLEDPAPRVEETLARREMSGCIDAYIARLPASYRTAVILSEQEGLTNQEIADALGVSVPTVKIRLHRARTRLRKALGSGCDFYRDERNEFACEPKKGGVSPTD